MSHKKLSHEDLKVGDYVCVAGKHYKDSSLNFAIGKVAQSLPSVELFDDEVFIQFPFRIGASPIVISELRRARKSEGEIAFWDPEAENRAVFGIVMKREAQAKKLISNLQVDDF